MAWNGRRSPVRHNGPAMLEIDQLRLVLRGPPRDVVLLESVSLSLAAGRTLALVGESGSGKSLTALAVLGLLPAKIRPVGGSIRLDGRDLLALSERELGRLRGARMAMVFQEPMTALNPVLPVGHQVAEPLGLHAGLRGRTARMRVRELLASVGLSDPDRVLRSYPHELSGGMCQRVVIAMALACRPGLLIADEPTTALDVTVQAQIVDLLVRLQREQGMAVLFITHDLALAGQFADEVAVLYAGRVVERAPTPALFAQARHPYTLGLLRSLPEPGPAPRGRPLAMIPGEPPEPHRRPPGCAFHPRCERGSDEAACRGRAPELELIAPGHSCACWLWGRSP